MTSVSSGSPPQPGPRAGSSARQSSLVESEAAVLAALAALDPRALCGWMLDSMSEGVSLIDEAGTILYASPAFHRLYGYEPGMLVGRNVLSLRAAGLDEAQQAMAAVRAEIAACGVWLGELQNRRADGTPFATACTAVRLPGEGQYWACLQRDISEQRRLEEAIVENRRRLEQLGQTSQDLFWVRSADGMQLFYTSGAFEQIWGRPREVFSQDLPSLLAAIHDDDRERVALSFARQSADAGPGDPDVEYRIWHPDGTLHWLWTRYSVIRDAAGQVERVAGLTRDITDRKELERALARSHAELERRVVERTAELARVNEQLAAELAERHRVEQSLRESEATNRALIEAVPDLVFRIAADGRLLGYRPPRDEEAFPSQAQLLGQSVDELLPVSINAELLATFASARRSGRVESFKFSVETASGQREFEARIAATSAGECLGVVRDVSVQHAQERQLQESERRLREILDSMYIFAALFTPDGRIIEVNRSPLEAAGITREEVLGQPVWETYPGAYSSQSQGLLRDAFAQVAAGQTVRYDVPIRVAGGHMRIIDAILVPLRDAAGQVVQVVGSAVDVTDRVQQAQELQARQAELAHVLRVATMGEMAAGIAHELNQPLMAVASYAEALAIESDRGASFAPATREIVGKIAAQSTRAGEIVRRLRDLIRKAPPQVSAVDVNELVEAVLPLVSPEAQAFDVSLAWRPTRELGSVSVDHVQIEQVLINLIRNAIEAIDGAGSPERRVTITARQPDQDFVILAVTDTGPGIPPEQCERIFEAFRTTKSTGLGMGLAICRTIIEGHGGRLWCECRPGRGAVFQVALPVRGGKHDR